MAVRKGGLILAGIVAVGALGGWRRGLIGTALRGALEKAGHRMVPMVRSQASGDAVHWDPDRGQIDSGGLEGVGAVVHLAGEGIGNRRWNEVHKAKVKESRTRGTSLLAETLAKLNKAPAVLVSGSAVGYYGGDHGDQALTEDSPPGTGFLADVVRQWEAAALPALLATMPSGWPSTRASAVTMPSPKPRRTSSTEPSSKSPSTTARTS